MCRLASGGGHMFIYVLHVCTFVDLPEFSCLYFMQRAHEGHIFLYQCWTTDVVTILREKHDIASIML